MKINEKWKANWRSSAHGIKMASLDNRTPSKAFLSTISNSKITSSLTAPYRPHPSEWLPLQVQISRQPQIPGTRSGDGDNSALPTHLPKLRLRTLATQAEAQKDAHSEGPPCESETHIAPSQLHRCYKELQPQ